MRKLSLMARCRDVNKFKHGCVLVQRAIKVNLSWLLVIKVSSCVIDRQQQQQASSLLPSRFLISVLFLSLHTVCFLLPSTSTHQ